MLKRRYEFIGLDAEGFTVTGHVYAATENEVDDFLFNGDIEEYEYGYAGFLPEPCILSWNDIQLIRQQTEVTGTTLHLYNQWKQEFLERLDEND